MTASAELLLIAILLALCACFAGLETALVSLGEVKLRSRLDENSRPPKTLLLWRDRPTDILATILIGNTAVNITISALATDMTETLLEGSGFVGWGLPIAIALTTVVVLIVGEVVPKTYARQNPDKMLIVLPVLGLAHVVFYPLMRVLVRLTHGVVHRLGGTAEATSTVTDEDIEEMVRIGKSDGSMSPTSARLLTGIFDLDDKVAREIMVPRTDIRAFEVEVALEEVMRVVKETGHSRYPVFEGTIDNIVGVLYIKDFYQAALTRDRSHPPKIRDVLRKPMVRPWNIGVQDLFLDMQKERVHMAVIASEYGGVAGIVTLEDIIEEVFGPIYDEHDRALEPIRKQTDGSWLVDGLVSMSELEHELETDFPDDEEADYETVAGLLMQEAGRVPEAGFGCDYQGFRFEVVRADALRVREVAIMRVPPPVAADVAAATSE